MELLGFRRVSVLRDHAPRARQHRPRGHEALPQRETDGTVKGSWRVSPGGLRTPAVRGLLWHSGPSICSIVPKTPTSVAARCGVPRHLGAKDREQRHYGPTDEGND
jgi:hypothetical protein